jgi:hypothetical protein
MNRNLRILGMVACLLVLWMVVRGTNGCAVPDPEIPPPEQGDDLTITSPDHADFNDALVFSGGHQLLDYNLTPPAPVELPSNGGTITVKIKWYGALEGLTPSGMLTIISKQDKIKHVHHSYAVPSELNVDFSSYTNGMCAATPCP